MDLWDVQVQALLNDYFLKTRGGAYRHRCQLWVHTGLILFAGGTTTACAGPL